MDEDSWSTRPWPISARLLRSSTTVSSRDRLYTAFPIHKMSGPSVTDIGLDPPAHIGEVVGTIKDLMTTITPGDLHVVVTGVLAVMITAGVVRPATTMATVTVVTNDLLRVADLVALPKIILHPVLATQTMVLTSEVHHLVAVGTMSPMAMVIVTVMVALHTVDHRRLVGEVLVARLMKVTTVLHVTESFNRKADHPRSLGRLYLETDFDWVIKLNRCCVLALLHGLRIS